jgi:photosystem II stability/assembly factor-like uncharacterized protein
MGEKVIVYKNNAGPDNPIHYSTTSATSWTTLAMNNGSQSHTGPQTVWEPAYYPSWSSWTLAGKILFDPLVSGRVWLTNGFGVYRADAIDASAAQWHAQMRNLEELVPTVIKKAPSSPLLLGSMDMVGFALSALDTVPQTKLEPQEMGIMTGADYCESNPSVMVRIGSGQQQSWKNFCAVSRDRGSTWHRFASTPPNFHNGAIALSATDENHWLWAPQNDYWNPVYLPHYTTDGGSSWQACSGLPATFNGVSHMWAANQFICADRVNGQLFYYYTHYNGQAWGGFLYRSEDGGASFSLASSGLESKDKVKIEAVPGKEGHLFAAFPGGKGLYFSSDRGTTFKAVTGVERCDVFGFGAPLETSSHPTIFMAGSVGGVQSIFLSRDYGVSWEDINDGAVPVDRISVMEGDRNRAGRVYIGCGGRGFFYGDKAPLSRIEFFALPQKRANHSARLTEWNLLGRQRSITSSQGVSSEVRIVRSANGLQRCRVHLRHEH